MLVAQSSPMLCNPMDCSPPCSSVHGILQARMLEWVAVPFPEGLSDPGIEPGSPALQADSLLLSHQGRPLTGQILSFPPAVDQRPMGPSTEGLARRDLTLEPASEKALSAPGLTSLLLKRAPDTRIRGDEQRPDSLLNQRILCWCGCFMCVQTLLVKYEGDGSHMSKPLKVQIHQMLFICYLMFNEEEMALPQPKQIKARTSVLQRSDCSTVVDWLCLQSHIVNTSRAAEGMGDR